MKATKIIIEEIHKPYSCEKRNEILQRNIIRLILRNYKKT